MADTHSMLLAAVNTAAFLLCVSFIAYVLLIIVPFVRRRPAPRGDASSLSWHVIIPCLNEQAVIEHTVVRLVTTYPQLHVWCVDDASSDETPEIVDRLAKRYERVHAVARELPRAQRGKGAALNAAWHAISGAQPQSVDRHRVIVGVVDADGRLGPDCLEILAGPDAFANDAVGAVQIQVRMSECVHRGDPPERTSSRMSRLLVRLQDVEFSSVIAAIQVLRHHIGSVGMGGNGQFTRLSVLDGIADEHGTPWHGSLLEDLELGLHVLLAGSRTEYVHDAWVAQQALPSVRQLVRQRSRWAQGSMQCLRYLWPVLRSPSISTAGAIEISYFLLLPWLQIAGSVVYAACAVIMVWYVVTLPGGLAAWFTSGAWGVAPLFVCFGLAPLAIWGPLYRRRAATDIRRRHAVALGLANWPYSYVHYAAVWWAFARLVRHRNDWKKTTRFVDTTSRVHDAVPARAVRRGRICLDHHPSTTPSHTVVGKLTTRPHLEWQREEEQCNV